MVTASIVELLSGLRRGWVMDELDAWSMNPLVQLGSTHRRGVDILIDLTRGEPTPAPEH